MDIKPVDVTVKGLLQGGFFKIPRFQRPYSWDRENVADFWEDAIVNDEPDYFIGSFVLYKSKGNADLQYIVDGQQRLTTITLLLASTRDALHSQGHANLAKAVQRLIETEDINSELRFVLDSETPYPYLQDNIQKYDEEKEEIEDLGTEQESLKSAYEFFQSCIQKAIESIEIDTTVGEQEKEKRKRKKLEEIRDRVLRLQLITVELGNADDAYLIFETLNTRGKDLTVSDLVKNHLTRLLKPKNKKLDVVKDKWKEILTRFDQSEIDISVSRFLHHAWLSRNQYVSEKKLFKEIKRTVKKPNAKKYLDSLVSDSKLYRQVLDPGSHKWTKQERAIKESLQAFQVFRIVQPVPMLLSLLRVYRSKKISMKQLRTILRQMENFHVQFTAITSQRTGGGTGLMYYSSARQLLEAKSKATRDNVLKEFVQKLKDRVPVAGEFDAGFAELWFTDDQARQRQLVRYILRRLDEHLRTGAKVDYDSMNIEHIAPQSADGKTTVSNDCIGMIGNLLLIDTTLNEKLGNKAPVAKIKAFRAQKIPLDSKLQTTKSWDDKAVDERTREVAELFRKKIVKV